MAITLVTEYYGDAGKIWQRIVGIWTNDWLQTSFTSWVLTLDTSTGYLMARIVISTGVNGRQFDLVDMGMPATARYPADYLVSLPGWSTFPGILAPTFPGKSTSSGFSGLLFPARAWMLEHFASATTLAVNVLNWAMGPVAGTNAYIGYTVWRENAKAGADTLALVTTGSTNAFSTGGNPLAGGSKPATPVFSTPAEASTPTAEQWDAMVAALNDIALIDVDYQANNGGAIFSFRGKVRNE